MMTLSYACFMNIFEEDNVCQTISLMSNVEIYFSKAPAATERAVDTTSSLFRRNLVRLRAS